MKEHSMNLDRLDLKLVDPDNMAGRIRELPMQCMEAWEKVRQLKLPAAFGEVANVAILGMGGSAIGGDLVRTLVSPGCRVPVSVIRDYDLPGWVNARTLVIASSYSGNTEETLCAFGQAVDRRCKLAVITTGGRLQAAAESAKARIFKVTYEASPRAALGYSVTPLLGIFQQLGFVDDQNDAMAEAVQVMQAWQREIDENVPTAENAAKQMATRLAGKIVVAYGSGLLSEVARRWKGQVNENAKNWAFYESLPELNHNAVLGYAHPDDLASRLTVVMLTSNTDHPRVTIRQQITAEILGNAGVQVEWAAARGERPLAQMLSIIHFGDYVSFYLALLNGADPTRIDAINHLKEVLSAS
jgi:glucose/mannose-6-phosphate isomerase